MSSHRKKIDLRTQRYAMFTMDFFILGTIFLGISLFSAARIDFGVRNLFVLNAINAAITLLFMFALEEYAPIVSGFREHLVIYILSPLYSFILVSLVNLIIFRSTYMLWMQLIFMISSMALLTAINAIVHKRLGNPEKFQKQRLLIIECDQRNFSRMKRMKYGTLEKYDSWYEYIDENDPEAVQRFIDTQFQNFDAICMLDKIKDDIYDRIVKGAMAMNKDLYIVPKMVDIGRSNAKLVRFDDILAFYLPKYSLSIIEEFLKRAMDLVISGVGVIFAAIPMLFIALAIKLSSPGPVFYKQIRLTKNKREFYIYKFRTMVPDAEQRSGPVFAQKDDPRVTKIGKILRRYRLDELPQILNILKGDMSVVGPRPERPFFVEQFEKEIDHYDYRFVVKAGLTSLSHVYGRYSTYIHDRTCYDLLYISNYSLLLDLKIMLLTSKTLFIKSSAEGEDEYKTSNATDYSMEREMR